MGQDQSQILSNNNPNTFPQINLSKSLFEFLYVIGRGGFGKVWKVNLKKTKKCYALKEMSKLKIILRRSEKSIQSERELLSNLYHPFLVNMICAFQDYENLYLIMDLFKGGDLRYHIFINKKFTENQSKFFCANVILGLEYIHKNNIIHRDIKPENLVLDSNGYLAITDFGVAIKNNKNNSNETSGTPGYMAPEVLCSLNHSFFVDFYAVGVMAYEFMMGHRPYLGRNRKEIKEAVLSKQVIISRKILNENKWSFESGDFINRMIQRKVFKRLGYNGINEIKNHFWFKDIDWNELMKKNAKSPFIPKDGDNFDKKFCEASDNFFDIDENAIDKYKLLIKRKELNNLFWNYTYIREEEKQQVLQNYYNDNNTIINNNKLRQSYVKIIHNDKKYPLRIINNNNINNLQILNDENKNCLNYNNNYNGYLENYVNSSKSTINIFGSPKNNGKVFHKKRASKNSIILDKNATNDFNNNIINNNKNYRNSVIIINPYYNQNINYFSNNNLFNDEPLNSKNINNNIFIQNDNSIHNKTKSFDNFLNNYEEKNNIKNSNNNINKNPKQIKIKLRNNYLKINKKNNSSSLQSSYSLEKMKKTGQINQNNKIENNIIKERIIYSPPHIISAKINSKNKNKNILINPYSNRSIDNYDNNAINIFSTKNNNNIRSINFYNEKINKNNLIDKENYCTLDYTFDNYNNNTIKLPSFDSNTFKKNVNNRNSANIINPNKLYNGKNASTININENRFDNNEPNNNILYSTLNRFLYKKNNATISYSSVNSNKMKKKINPKPTCLYSNNQIMKEKIFNNANIKNYSTNKIKEQKSFKEDNQINTSNNNKSKDNIKITNQILNNKNNFNKRKNIKNNNEKYTDINNLNKSKYNLHSKLWSTSENNINKINNLEQSFSSTIKNNKENINNNFLTNDNNITQIKVTLIPKPQIKNKNNN